MGPGVGNLGEQQVFSNQGFYCAFVSCEDQLFGIVVSTSDCHPRGPGFDSRLYPRNFSKSLGYGTGSTQPREANWVAA